MEVSDADLRLAACWVADALEGRPLETGSASMIGRLPWDRLMYKLNTAALWEYWLEFLGVALMLRAFYEPAISATDLTFATCSREPSSTLLQGVEALTAACFCIDIYTKLTYMGRELYWAKSWHMQYFVVVGCLSLDAVSGAICGQRPFRFLRPMLIFLRNREQRRILTSLIHLVSHQLGVALLSTIGVVAFFGALGVHLYGESFDRGLELHLGVQSGDDNHLKGTFNSFVHASLEIWVLISSAENFLDLLLPALRTEDGGHTFAPLLVYFGPVLYLGYFFLMSVLLAVVVDEYLLAAKRLVQQEHHRERKGLLRAFALLNPNKSGHIGAKLWASMLQIVVPGMSRQEALLRYHMVAVQAPHKGVHVREFLKLHSNLSVSLIEDSQFGRKPVLSALPDALRFGLLVANALMFISYSPLHSASTRRLLFAGHTALLPLLILDRKSWLPSQQGVHVVCLSLATACAIIYWAHDRVLQAPPPTFARVGGHVAVLVLLVKGTRVLRLISHLLSYVLPQFLHVSVSLAMLVYVFGLVGMQLFSHARLFSKDEHFAHENLAGCGAPFSSLPCTLFILFQVMTNEDWHVIMRAMWYTSGTPGLTFILSFFLVINVCLLSLTTALTINAFLGAKTNLMDEGLLVDHSHLDEPTARHLAQPQRPPEEAHAQKHRTSAREGNTNRSATCACLCTSPLSRAASDAVSLSGDTACYSEDAARSGYHVGHQEVYHDDHQDLHLSIDGHSKHHMALKQAELAMMENEAAAFCGTLRSALGRQINTRSSRVGREMQPVSLKPSSAQTNREKSIAASDAAGSLAGRLSSRLLGTTAASGVACGGGGKRQLKAIAHAAAGGSRMRDCAGRAQVLLARKSCDSNGSEEGTMLLAPNVSRSDACLPSSAATDEAGGSSDVVTKAASSVLSSVRPSRAPHSPVASAAHDVGWVPSVAHVGVGACLEARPNEQSAIATSDAAWEARVDAREARLHAGGTAPDDASCALTFIVGARFETDDRLCSPKSSPGREVSLRAAMRTRHPEALSHEACSNSTVGLDQGSTRLDGGDAQRRQLPTNPRALKSVQPPLRVVGAVSASRSAAALPPRPSQLSPAGKPRVSSSGRQRTKVSARPSLHANESHPAEHGSFNTSAVTQTPEVQEGGLGHQSGHLKKWRIASTTVAAFARRAAAGMSADDEPLDEEEEAAIAELTRHEPEVS